MEKEKAVGGIVNPIIKMLVDDGLIQFGRFQQGNSFIPFRLMLEYLPAYPQLLSQIADVVYQQISGLGVDRLVATADSLPLGVALSLKSGISLVYSKGQDEAAVYDLVGAYNSGHKALLVITTLTTIGDLETIIKKAEQVGLSIQEILTLVDLEREVVDTDLPVITVLKITQIIDALTQANELTTGQAGAVYEWLGLSLRPSAARP